MPQFTNFIFDVEVNFQAIKVTFEFQGHAVNIKATRAENRYVLPPDTA